MTPTMFLQCDLSGVGANGDIGQISMNAMGQIIADASPVGVATMKEKRFPGYPGAYRR